jgi:hypothetical protein
MLSSAGRSSLHERVCACLTALPDNVQQAADELGRLDADTWPTFLDYAASHGVLAILKPAIDRRELPPAVRADVERRLLVQDMWGEQVSSALSSLLELFERAGIPVCALKGPMFAERFYARSLDRPSIDLDVLVRPVHLDAARRALLHAGFIGDSDLAASYLMAHSHHLHFAREGVPELELHFHGYHGFGTTMPAAALMDRASIMTRRDGTHALVPAPEDELIYLAAHAAGHSFIRLIWLFDVKMLLQRTTIDWNVVVQRSRALRLENAVTCAVSLAEQWMGVPGPGGNIGMAAGGWRRRIASRLLDVVAAPSTPSAADNFGGLMFTALLCDRVGAASGLVAHHVIRTTKHRVHRMAPRLVPASWSA